MAEGAEGLGVRVMATASYFFPEIANYLQMLQSATNMRRRTYWNRPCLLSAEQVSFKFCLHSFHYTQG